MHYIKITRSSIMYNEKNSDIIETKIIIIRILEIWINLLQFVLMLN